MSRTQIHSLRDEKSKVSNFRTETKAKISRYALKDVFNSDQSGFNIELLSGRSLTYRGSADVISSVQQSHSSTHSYTIQPLISMSGELNQRLLIVLQEKKGRIRSRGFSKFVSPSRNFCQMQYLWQSDKRTIKRMVH